MRRVISYLISTGPVGDGSWRWKFTTVLALIGPGSVPLALLLFANQSEMLLVTYHMDWGPVLGAMTGAAVIVARFRPVVAALLVMGVLLSTALGSGDFGYEPWPMTVPSIFAYLVVQFALARDCRVWVSIGAWLAYVAAGTWALWAVNARILHIVKVFPFDANPASENLSLVALYGALAFLAGLSVRIWRHGRSRVAEEEQVASAERGRRRMLEERTRIARELHDIVAHHMSVIAVQASTAEYRLQGLDDAARAEFQSISEQARESLTEMRRLLAVLRNEDEAGLREPQPGPEGIGGLVEAVDRSGTPTTLTTVDLPGGLPETVALTVYRVVQEALSNVVRHAAGAATEVEVRGEDGSVVVTVVNAPPPDGGAPPEPDGAGLGLVGMRERVVLEGGTLDAGPTARGGFRVRAVLPATARPTAQEPTS
ncbi:histidine kinase [Glycomyces tarimensis]